MGDEKDDEDKDDDKDEDAEKDEGEVVLEGMASSLSKCDYPMCSACSVAHMSNKPEEKFHICTDETQYTYRYKCRSRMSKELCNKDDLCFVSWPVDDADVF